MSERNVPSPPSPSVKIKKTTIHQRLYDDDVDDHDLFHAFSSPVLSPSPTAMDKPTLRRLLECPVCFRLPRPSSGVRVYLCSEGHSLCSRCFERLPRRECPQGRCDFAKPEPTRNRTAEAMAEEADFDAPCRNGDDGCDFEGKKDSLARHEAKCDKGRVPCVEGGSCKAR